MTALSGKQDYSTSYPKEVEGSAIANAALLKATLAFDRIERHEQDCSKRWSIVVKMMLLVLAQLGGLLFFLVSDKLGWLS